ncbi:hypothetical protein QOZ80_8BG0643490 [Eleusine coracana subsp. coracana]|nr:hypothetical protein QOZ80_8BG0643490 [Eleusine coracana subsp. coracana]
MMGKTHRFSKGHQLGFVPDYRHGVETVEESRGIGSPSRIDSGSSCAPPKRKCISMETEDGEGASGFNVPREGFTLTQMRAVDRKDLEARLRNELAQVRALQNRLLSRGAAASMNGGAMSAPGGDVHLLKKKGDKLKRNNSVQSGRGVPPLQDPPVTSSINYTASFRQCANLLKNIMTHVWAKPFLEPVDVVKHGVPDYFDHVTHPMDLGTVKKKLNVNMYATPLDFAADVRLTFSNAMIYNPVNNDVHIMAKKLNKDFEARWRLIEKKLPQPDQKPPVLEPITKNATKRDTIEKEAPAQRKPSKKGASKKDMFQKQDLVDNPVLLPKKRKASPVEDAPTVVSVVPTGKEIMTEKQKFDLSTRLESYGAYFPEHILEFIRSHAPNCDGSEEELELDIGALSDDVLFELQKLVHDYDRDNQSRNHTKEDPHEAESQSQFELVNSSGHHEEDNELIDEDIDIGENDLPVSTHPPVVFEDEIADRSSKHSTSSSSSSDSESSSSGSDSSSSSGSDMDAKALQQNSSSKENVLPVDSSNQEKGSLNSSNPPEQSVNPIPVPADGEGGNVSEDQVSPEKIRRALLKSRFADTILKAREKTLDQVTQKDPEKLRREREELERLQREERARLQAEAKAAEDARKKAEAAAAAEAAAEAKRQRELEREAARKALQEMEKTVDINEGSLFLKDLEMLGSVTGDQIPSSVGETSPTHMPDALGFELGGNALEKLGLFRKNDEEEDEESDSTDGLGADVEEGEID